jgi:hypothetical protein
MPVNIGIVDRLIVARMEGPVDRADVDTIVASAADAAKRRGGQVVYLGINAPSFVTPPPELRTYIVDKAADLLKSVTSMELVLEGDGLSTALLRTVVRGMVMVGRAKLGSSGKPRSFIHARVEDALKRVSSQLMLPPEDVPHRLAALGLLGERARLRAGVVAPVPAR